MMTWLRREYAAGGFFLVAPPYVLSAFLSGIPTWGAFIGLTCLLSNLAGRVAWPRSALRRWTECAGWGGFGICAATTAWYPARDFGPGPVSLAMLIDVLLAAVAAVHVYGLARGHGGFAPSEKSPLEAAPRIAVPSSIAASMKRAACWLRG